MRPGRDRRITGLALTRARGARTEAQNGLGIAALPGFGFCCLGSQRKMRYFAKSVRAKVTILCEYWRQHRGNNLTQQDQNILVAELEHLIAASWPMPVIDSACLTLREMAGSNGGKLAVEALLRLSLKGFFPAANEICHLAPGALQTASTFLHFVTRYNRIPIPRVSISGKVELYFQGSTDPISGALVSQVFADLGAAAALSRRGESPSDWPCQALQQICKALNGDPEGFAVQKVIDVLFSKNVSAYQMPSLWPLAKREGPAKPREDTAHPDIAFLALEYLFEQIKADKWWKFLKDSQEPQPRATAAREAVAYLLFTQGPDKDNTNTATAATLLHDPDMLVRRAAARALCEGVRGKGSMKQQHFEEVVVELTAALEDTDDMAKSAAYALAAIQHIHQDSSWRLHENALVRLEFIKAAADEPHAKTLPQLIVAVEDQSLAVRDQALLGMAQFVFNELDRKVSLFGQPLRTDRKVQQMVWDRFKAVSSMSSMSSLLQDPEDDATQQPPDERRRACQAVHNMSTTIVS